MTMKDVKITATPRKKSGTKAGLRKLRAADAIPAVVYGKANGSEPVAIERKAFELAYRDHLRHAFYVLEMEGKERRTLIKDVQRHKIDGRILHVDFFEFDPARKTVFTVPVVTRGQSVGEKAGGILTLVMQELKLRAVPTAIPDKIEIDVTGLDLNHSIRVRDLGQTAYEVIAHPEDPIVAIVAPRGVEETAAAAPAEGEAAEGAAKPADGKAPAADAKAAPAAAKAEAKPAAKK